MKNYQIIDTHAHLCDSNFDEDRYEVIARAKDSGITNIIIMSENLKDARKNFKLTSQFPILRPAVGLYPSYLNWDQAQKIHTLIRNESKNIWAIGEVGLDYWIIEKEEDKELQKKIFSSFIDLALETNLPLNVHSRSAGREAVSLLIEKKASKVQLHAFDGKASSAQPAVDAGFYFSIPPSITRSRQKQKLVKKLPLSCILIETDSPVLGPDSKSRNEPANALIVVETIAEIHKISREKVLDTVLENTKRLYGEEILAQ